jgi:hypothetical protein
MDETDPVTTGTRVAVALLKLWLEQDRLSAAHIEGVLTDPKGPNAAEIIAGQLNLGMLLLLMLAEERGASAEDMDGMMEEARGILQDLSEGLPE